MMPLEGWVILPEQKGERAMFLSDDDTAEMRDSTHNV